MKKINSMALVLLMGLACLAKSGAAQKEEQLVWHTDLMEAAKVSTTTQKPIFAFFTGSDWCPWCRRLQSLVFSKPEFVRWANAHVVLLELDFPRHMPQSDKLAQQNNQLQQLFKVNGFPTVWLFFIRQQNGAPAYDLDIIGSLAYPQAAPGEETLRFVEAANRLLEKGKAK